VRDPTTDARVIAFTFSVPDHIYRKPREGIDRWLIREAMKNRLPDSVRLNQRRGQQAADLVPRLRACADEVEVVLGELEHGPAATYVDVTYMRQAWQCIKTENTPDSFYKSATILTRGIMAGLFVNDHYA
jgi:asparagine synthase (glutamine-hydrolysing)